MSIKLVLKFKFLAKLCHVYTLMIFILFKILIMNMNLFKISILSVNLAKI